MRGLSSVSLARAATIALVVSIAAPTTARGALPQEIEQFAPKITRLIEGARGVELRPQTVLRPLEQSAYGVTDSGIVSQLDAARTDERQAIDTAVADQILTDEQRDALRDCYFEGLKGVADDYRAVADSATPGVTPQYPSFLGDFSNHAAMCLVDKYGEASGVEQLAQGLAAEAVPAAQEAYDADSGAFVNWLSVTSREPTPGPSGPTDQDGTDTTGGTDSGDHKGSGVPTIVWLALGAAAVIGIGIAGSRRSSG
jgi:hypothetical protein